MELSSHGQRAHWNVEAHPAGMGRFNHYSYLQWTPCRCSLPVDQARLKVLTTPHAGDWLLSPPLTVMGLRLSDGTTPVIWSRRKPLVRDVTVPDTYAASHIQATANSTGAAAEKVFDNKKIKYSGLVTTHIFIPIAVEISVVWCSQSAQFDEDLGRRITAVTNEPLETIYLYQRLSVSLQRGNAVAFNNTFPET